MTNLYNKELKISVITSSKYAWLRLKVLCATKVHFYIEKNWVLFHNKKSELLSSQSNISFTIDFFLFIKNLEECSVK